MREKVPYVVVGELKKLVEEGILYFVDDGVDRKVIEVSPVKSSKCGLVWVTVDFPEVQKGVVPAYPDDLVIIRED